MEQSIEKLKSAHDKLMCITLSAQDAVQFSSGIMELRQAIVELEMAIHIKESVETE